MGWRKCFHAVRVFGLSASVAYLSNELKDGGHMVLLQEVLSYGHKKADPANIVAEGGMLAALH